MRRQRVLKAVLVLVGLLFLAAIYPMTDSLWHANHADYAEDMLLSVYFALGIFLLMAARNPSANRTLILFAGWSSIAHASVMTVMAVQKADERRGFLLAVALFVVIGIALIVLAPAKHAERPSAASATLP